MSGWYEQALEAACRALMDHPDGTDRTSQDGCMCGEERDPSLYPTHAAEEIVAALAPVVEAEVRRGQAEALREAAAAVMPFDGRTREAKALTQWLRDRADAIEAGDPR